MSNSAEFLRGYEPHAQAETVANLWSTWNTGKQSWRDRVAETIQYIYATSTRETANANVGGEEGEGWSHSTHIPKLTQIHDNLGANYASALFGGREWFTFSPGEEAATFKGKLNAITSYLRTKHEWNDLEDVFLQLLNDWVQTGNCFARVAYVREMFEDARTGAMQVQYEGPRVQRISPYDIVMDYTATSFEKSPIIIKSTMNRADLLIAMEDQPDLGYDEAAVAKVIEFRTVLSNQKESDINKHIQMQYDGFNSASQYFSSGQIEILEFMGDLWDDESGTVLRNQVITVADRRFILRSRGVDSLDGRRGVYHCGWRLRPDNLWAMGPLDNLVGMQYLIDHLENARADAFDQMLSPDRVHIGNVQIEEEGPVTNYYVDDAQGDVRNLSPDATVLQADLQIQIKEAQMEAYAGAPREAMGIRTPGEKTKFEVSALMNAAGRLFQHKLDYFERNFLEKILQGELEVAVRNLNGADVIKTLDDDLGVEEFMEITADDITARGKIKAQGASHFSKKATALQELTSFNNILAGDQNLAVHFPAKARAAKMADALGFDDTVFVPFGGVAEQLELAQLQQAAQAEADESAAATDAAVEESI